MIGEGHLAFATAAPLIGFATVLAGSLGVPIPTLAGLIYLGSVLEKSGGHFGTPAVVFAAAIAAAIIGDLTWFGLGRRYGGTILKLLCRLSLTRDSCIRQTTDFFVQRGVKIMLVARFVPGLATVSAPIAGASGVRMGTFLLYDIPGAALWIGTGLGLGYAMADQVRLLLLRMQEWGLDLGGAAAFLTMLYIAFAWFRRHQLLRELRMSRISADELIGLVAAGTQPIIIDARSPLQRVADPFVIPGSLLWHEDLANAPRPILPIAKPVIIYCACPNEVSAATLAKQLRKHGYRHVRPLLGGIDGWRATGQPVVPAANAAVREQPRQLAAE